MTDWTNAHYADGPLVAEWFQRHVPYPTKSTIERRVNAWKHGEQASIDTLDRYLTEYHLHLSDLPDEVWRLDPVITLLDKGMAVRAVARELGVTPSTVRWHRSRYAGMVAA